MNPLSSLCWQAQTPTIIVTKHESIARMSPNHRDGSRQFASFLNDHRLRSETT